MWPPVLSGLPQRFPERAAGPRAGVGTRPTSRRGVRPALGAPHEPSEAVRVGKGGPAAGVSVRACPEANDPKLGPTLSRCGGCDPRLRASCHAAGWAHGRVAKRPFREKCRWASPSLFFRLHVLLAPLCAYPPRFLSRCAPSAVGNYSLLRQKCRWPAASLFFGLRSSLLPCSRALRASTYTYPKSGRPGRG